MLLIHFAGFIDSESSDGSAKPGKWRAMLPNNRGLLAMILAIAMTVGEEIPSEGKVQFFNIFKLKYDAAAVAILYEILWEQQWYI